jgi:hypothetical protein
VGYVLRSQISGPQAERGSDVRGGCCARASVAQFTRPHAAHSHELGCPADPAVTLRVDHQDIRSRACNARRQEVARRIAAGIAFYGHVYEMRRDVLHDEPIVVRWRLRGRDQPDRRPAPGSQYDFRPPPFDRRDHQVRRGRS